MSLPSDQPAEYERSSVNPPSLLAVFLAAVVGLLAAILVLPAWLPNLAASLMGPAPKAYWLLSRSSAFVALGLLWFSVMLGLGMTNKLARTWPGAPAAFAVHEYASLLGLGFGLFHALILLGDRFIGFDLAQVLIPFAASAYRPAWVGLGQTGLYAWAIITLSFYVRGQIGQRAWRWLHYATFGLFLMAVLHGLGSGTDSSLAGIQRLYWILGGSVLFMTVYRVLAALSGPAPRRSPQVT